MINFNSIILKAISNYKLILRKNLPTSKCGAKLRELGIKRQNIRETDEVGLYHIGLKIIDDLKKNLNIDKNNKNKKSNNSYHGTLEFLQYLESVFVNYCIEDNRVVHVGQKASSSLVSAIQLIATTKGKLTESKLRQILQYGNIVATYGTKEQREIFLNAVSEHQSSLGN